MVPIVGNINCKIEKWILYAFYCIHYDSYYMTHPLWKWSIWTVSFEIQELYGLKSRRIVEIFRRYKLFRCNVCRCTHWNNFSQKCDLRVNYLGKTPRKAAAIPGNIKIIARFDGLEFMYIGFSSDSVLSLKDFVIYFRDT